MKIETYVVGVAGHDCQPVPLRTLLDMVEKKLGAEVVVLMPTVTQRLRIKARKKGRTARVVVHEEKLHAIGDDLLKNELKSAIETTIEMVRSERNG